MTVEDLLAQDAELRAEADGMVETTGLLTILSGYGRAHLSGSYAMQLMTWRDLDIYLEMSEVSVTMFAAMTQRLIAALQPRRASFIDQWNYESTEAIRGLYLGIRHQAWKIDVWGVPPAICAEKVAHSTRIAAALDGAMRIAVLSIKNTVCRDPRYRDTVTSQDIYDAVLLHGVRDTEAFWRHIDERITRG